ncbi:hypothetical protein J7I98_11725 [Streptomyces sp. ISL-98]|uniref:hypothetical protein n=1 Tax=Streptomyces sp. ISL-98 TaxID=2819192 RepID=UPI001BE59486|nr:hypothetical protein [Streptomyces sp. ISL-98]MBT2506553.1 hypothetical protein [Streptomyces sp. ISL-98]
MQLPEVHRALRKTAYAITAWTRGVSHRGRQVAAEATRDVWPVAVVTGAVMVCPAEQAEALATITAVPLAVWLTHHKRR